MKLSERDKLLALLLPAVVIALGYTLFVLRTKVNEVTRAENALAEARSKAPSRDVILVQNAQLQKVTKENAELKAKLDGLDRQWRYATAFCTGGGNRNERIEKLTALLNKYDLHAVEDAEAESGKESSVSAAIEKLAQRVTHGATNAKPYVRRIRFQGTYADVHSVLDGLAQNDLLGVPVSLTMKQTDVPARHEWLLLLWI